MTRQRLSVMSRSSNILEWPLRQFARAGNLRDLPGVIQRALVYLWRAEQDGERTRRSSNACATHRASRSGRGSGPSI